jgi:dTDP-4-amino-4,6-dideoxygalactose transaminase
LDELQAAFLRVRLSHLDQWNQQRRVIAAAYFDGLKGLNLELPPADSNESSSSWHLYVVKTEKRDQLRSYLGEKGITTLVHYPIAPAKQEAYANQGSFIEQEPYDAANLLSLPIGPQMSSSMVNFVIESIKKFSL